MKRRRAVRYPDPPGEQLVSFLTAGIPPVGPWGETPRQSQEDGMTGQDEAPGAVTFVRMVPTETGTRAETGRWPAAPTLEQMQHEVGGYLEAVGRPLETTPGQFVQVWVNEEARLYNALRSVHWPFPGSIDGYLRGRVLVVGQDDEGEPRSLTAEEVALVTRRNPPLTGEAAEWAAIYAPVVPGSVFPFFDDAAGDLYDGDPPERS